MRQIRVPHPQPHIRGNQARNLLEDQALHAMSPLTTTTQTPVQYSVQTKLNALN
jgi:hypothetical protein